MNCDICPPLAHAGLRPGGVGLIEGHSPAWAGQGCARHHHGRVWPHAEDQHANRHADGCKASRAAITGRRRCLHRERRRHADWANHRRDESAGGIPHRASAEPERPLATVYQHLGIDPNDTFMTSRPSDAHFALWRADQSCCRWREPLSVLRAVAPAEASRSWSTMTLILS